MNTNKEQVIKLLLFKKLKPNDIFEISRLVKNPEVLIF